MDRVVHAQHSIVVFLAEQGIGKPEWKKYRDKNQGRHDFQIDLGISLLNYGIGLDWDGESRDRPSYMRKGAFKPCECNMCFFCMKGLTNGITHQKVRKLSWSISAECGWKRMSVPTCGWVWEWNQVTIVECVTESKWLLNCWQRRERTGAEPLLWDVQSARNLFAKSAGKRGTISMHKIT